VPDEVRRAAVVEPERVLELLERGPLGRGELQIRDGHQERDGVRELASGAGRELAREQGEVTGPRLLVGQRRDRQQLAGLHAGDRAHVLCDRLQGGVLDRIVLGADAGGELGDLEDRHGAGAIQGLAGPEGLDDSTEPRLGDRNAHGDLSIWARDVRFLALPCTGGSSALARSPLDREIAMCGRASLSRPVTRTAPGGRGAARAGTRGARVSVGWPR
jgi:hypothetical protein